MLLISIANAGSGERERCNYDIVVEIEEPRRAIKAKIVAGNH